MVNIHSKKHQKLLLFTKAIWRKSIYPFIAEEDAGDLNVRTRDRGISRDKATV